MKFRDYTLLFHKPQKSSRLDAAIENKYPMFEVTIQKLTTHWGEPIQYRWVLDGVEHPMNEYLGKVMRLQFLDKIHCIHCQKETRKSFNQGYCYRCFSGLARCDLCVLKPELCHYDAGTCREPQWGQAHCEIPHIIYLANTSDLKVGITRYTQIPTRWIDQGAVQAIPFLSVKRRYHAGLLEDILRNWVKDKTHWRKMLNADIPLLNMEAERARLFERCLSHLETKQIPYRYLSDQAAVSLSYPILAFPKAIHALSLEKTKMIEGTFLGIKGQYLLFDRGVLNVRTLTGYRVGFSITN